HQARAVAGRHHGVAFALESRSRTVTVHGHDEPRAEGAGAREIAHVAHVEQVEDSVREHDAFTRHPPRLGEKRRLREGDHASGEGRATHAAPPPAGARRARGRSLARRALAAGSDAAGAAPRSPRSPRPALAGFRALPAPSAPRSSSALTATAPRRLTATLPATLASAAASSAGAPAASARLAVATTASPAPVTSTASSPP